MSDLVPDAGAIDGHFHPAFSASARPARLSVAEGVVTVHALDDGAALVSADRASMEISARVGSIPRRIQFPDRSVFVSPDNDSIDAIGLARKGGLAIHALERWHPRLIAFALAAIGLMVGIYAYGIPVLTRIAVAVTPPAVEKLVGLQTLAILDRTLFRATGVGAARQESLRTGFAELVKHAGETGADYHLEFRRGGAIGPNAFALPGGTVIVTDELIKLAAADDEIIGVLAHEIAHVEERHSLQRVYRAAGVTAMITLIGGDIGDLTQELLVQGSAVLALGYSRNQESDADARGVALMRAAGRDPAALGRMLRRLEEECRACGESGWMSSHPGIKERVTEINRLAAEKPPASR